MTIKGASRDFLIALSLTLLIFTGAASAQEPAAQKPEQKPEAKPLATIMPKPSESELAAKQAVESPGNHIVIPPQPVIIKKSPNTIVIPVDEPSAPARYEQRPATATTPKVGSVYGYRRDPFTGRSKFHSGVDIKAAWGDPVGASHRGTVQFAGWYHGYGYLLIVNHGGGVTTYYAHLSSFALAVGDKVERGTIVGYAGSTGRATSPHLHYEVRVDGNAVNPLQPLALEPTSSYFAEPLTTPEETRPRQVSPGDNDSKKN
ncbi:MAG TPA: M23 family metallopeptidase [Blastocatellia bacterium]|nr:M23 family metallopeptidase [Blastocatellia bacterium]